MQPTVRTLLERPELALGLLADEAALPAGVLDRPIAWAHSSDLADPTPFLDTGHVLLTTGTQFGADAGDDDPAGFDAYVERLQRAGVAALGFGTEVIRAGTPAELVAACARHGLPLFEVPYRIPFIRIARTVADLGAAEAGARQAWSLAAQRAISLAALRPDGLGATLAELARQLGAWVGLVDSAGVLDREAPAGALPHPVLDAVVAESRGMLRAGRRAVRSVAEDGHRIALQTLGAGGALRGVLAIGDSAQLDAAGREVVGSVVALAGLALEQNRDLDRARGHLRSGLVRSILAGDVDLAAGVAAEMWGPLPAAPARVAVLDVPHEAADRLAEHLELQVDERGGRLFFGRDGDTVVLVLEDADTGLPGGLAVEFDTAAGISDPVADLGRQAASAHEQALRALERAREQGGGTVAFEEISRQGVLAFLARTDARAVAAATLAPLVQHDRETGGDLVGSLRIWLEHDGRYDAAAAALGVHRHTMRARVGQAERLLGRDLSGFHARADLWAALLAAQ